MHAVPRALIFLAILFVSVSAGAQVVISEFMAVNTNTNIVDEDGSHADWIELHNTGATSVSLNGWYLTDDKGDLREWQFPATTPAVTLAADARLRVWASGKNRKAAADRLHTNFSLNSSGEYLALVRSDGLTVEFDFDPEYPPQATDVSYGTSGGRQWNVLAGPSLNTDWKVRMPYEASELTDPAFLGGWTTAAYSDTAWATKRTTVSGGVAKGIGYEAGGSTGSRAFLINYGSPTGVVSSVSDVGRTMGIHNNDGAGPNYFASGAPSLCMRTTFQVNRSTVTGLRLNIRFDDGFILYLNGTKLLEQNAPASPTWNSVAPTDRTDETIATYDLTSFIANLQANATTNNVIAIHAFNDVKNSALFVVTPEIQAQIGGNRMNLIGPANNTQWKVKMPYSANEWTRMTTGTVWTSTAFGDAAWATKGTRVSGVNIQGIGYDSAGSGGPKAAYINYGGSPNGIVSAASDVGIPGFYIPNPSSGTFTDIFAGTPTLAMRTTFNVADKSTISALRLNLNYDDGFVVYLNGTEVLRQNAPATVAWNSASAADREDDQSEHATTIDLPGAASLLVNGSNILAIHALNELRNGGHFVITPSIEAFQTAAGGGSGSPGYLTTPTPGAENTVATTAIGPDISKTVSNPAQPAGGSGSAPLLVTARLKQTLGAIASVSCNYVINFGSEVSLAMFDDGPAGGHGDVTAGDGTYSVQLPTTSLLPGHFIRWRIVSTDAGGNVSTDPPYRDPYDNDQYYGTMAATPQVQSQLPVLYWFHNSTSTSVFATTEGGFRSMFFYKLPGEASGRFYDNVRVNLHGQSTAGFGKKSQNINFNADNRFKWRQGEKEIRGMNILSNFADKSHVRNSLAWETWNLLGHPSHWCQTIRVQQVTAGNLNAGTSDQSRIDAQFLCLTDMVEDGNNEYLERWDLDPEGALYKCYHSLDNTLQNSTTQGGGVEKKTRENEDFSDLAALVSAMNTSNSVSSRRQWLYDNVDVPALINYLAIHNLISSHDYGHKNYYIYRHTNGSGEWTLLPWDQDLSFGHKWTSANNYFDDDLDTASSILLGGGGNRLMNIVNTTGATELTQMYVRRLRTLMDQLYGPTSAPVNHFVNRIDAYLDLFDPPGWPVMTDAERDFQKWGFWVDGSGTVIPWTDSRAADHRIRPTAIRIKQTNNTVATGGPYPGANPYLAYGSTPNLHTSLEPFIPGRRKWLYNEVAGTTPSLNGQTIPAAQTANPSIIIESINFNPGSAGQDQEYFVLRNPNAFAVDISAWKLTGDIKHTFRAGTVIPAQGTSTSDGTSAGWVNQLVVARNAKTFRQRGTSPKGAEYRHVQGGYVGQLSARGGTITLSRPDNPLDPNTTFTTITSQAFTGAPTDAQNTLRVTEINFAPSAPTPAESTALPGVQASDFEFIELANTGVASLVLGNAQFDKGIAFVFPAGFTLAGGERTVLVSNQAAFALRYGSGFNIAGQFEGNLDNSGETLGLLDSVGERVLEFTYDDAWYPPADGGGYSLVTRSGTPPYNDYEAATAWAISGQQKGTPGNAESSFSQVFEGWRHDHFTAAEHANAAIGGLGADPDNDGWSNDAEYAFGKNPRTNDGPVSTEVSRVDVGGTHYLAITFTRRQQALDLTYVVESGDLSGWTTVDLPVGSPQNLGNGLERVTYRDNVPAGTTPRFIRVRAVR